MTVEHDAWTTSRTLRSPAGESLALRAEREQQGLSNAANGYGRQKNGANESVFLLNWALLRRGRLAQL